MTDQRRPMWGQPGYDDYARLSNAIAASPVAVFVALTDREAIATHMWEQGYRHVAAPVAERQTWERRIPGTDIAEVRIHLEVDAKGRVRLHEALAARLLHEAGWERTS